MKSLIRSLLRKLGIDVVRYPYALKSKIEITNKWKKSIIKLMKHHDVDLVLDVGANTGQYGHDLRNFGYQNKIVSFEPLTDAFRQLKLKAANDINWEVNNFALGDIKGNSNIHVAQNSFSSSLLDMLPAHEKSAPDSKYITTQNIQVNRLDDIFENYNAYDRIYLKLDVQGYEMNVLKGCNDHLNRIIGIQTEMSLIELYKGESTFFEYSDVLTKKGFKLMFLMPGFIDKNTGQLLQVDGIWYRS